MNGMELVLTSLAHEECFTEWLFMGALKKERNNHRQGTHVVL